MFFFSISSRFLIVFIFFNVLKVAAVRTSRVLLFSQYSDLKSIKPTALSSCWPSDSAM